MSETCHIPEEPLREAVAGLFRATGSPEDEAALVARLLVAANLAGHDSHGVLRAAQYMEWMRLGRLQAGRGTRVVRDHGAVAVLSGDWGYGQPAAWRAMTEAVARARTHHVAAVGLTEVNHIGRLADYAIMAAEQGMVGMVFASGGGFYHLVAPFGGAEARMGTNPIAVAFPSAREQPLVFDMATSAYAEGKFMVYRDAGRPAPERVLIDAEGRPTTRAEDLWAGGAILPLGGAQGYKGYLLNFLVEVLGGLLTAGGYAGQPVREGLNNCTLMIALDVEAFRPRAEFERELEGLVGYLKATRPRPDAEVLYPGEPEARAEAERRRTGIPLPAGTVDALQAELDRYGVDVRLAALAAAPPAS